MKREIKFRAWNPQEAKPHIFYFDLETIRDNDNEANWQNMEYVMQYTGLKDKNGKDIYEGDILEENHYAEPGYKIGSSISRVDFGPIPLTDTNGYILTHLSGLDMVHKSMDYSEIIGNIYENPELLK